MNRGASDINEVHMIEQVRAYSVRLHTAAIAAKSRKKMKAGSKQAII
jgi:hypothetical protein